MKTQVTSERIYTVSYFKPGTRDAYGVSVSVSGDRKTKVLREAQELLEAVQTIALEVHAKYFPVVAKEAKPKGEKKVSDAKTAKAP